MSSNLRALNSIGGFSVGDDPQIVIVQANGDITASNITANGSLVANSTTIYGNLSISNATAGWGVLTDNLYYSNGAPWDLSNPAGSTNYVQYNDGGAFGASANFQFTASTNTLQVTGTANVTGNVNVTDYLNGNIANFTGNLTAANANLGNLATANFINVSSNLKTANLNVTNFVTGDLIPNANVTFDLGNTTNRWRDIYLSGTSIYLGQQTITSNATAVSVGSADFAAANVLATANVIGNIIQSNTNVYANTGGIYANVGNIFHDLVVGGNANITETMKSGNANISGTTVTYQEQLTSLTSSQIVYGNGTSYLVGSSNFTFNDSTNTLTVTGNANVTNTLNGNVGNFSGAVSAASFDAKNGNLSNANVVSANSFTSQGGTANFNNSSQVNLGTVGNLRIGGGTANYVLTAVDTSGNVEWRETAATNSIHNGNSNVSIATANGNVTITAGGIYTWTFDASTGLFTAPGDIQTDGTVNANVITSAYDISSTNGNLNANSGTVNAGAANISGNISAGNANITTDLHVGGTANIANLDVGNIGTTGNIIANNVTVNLELAGNTANFSGNVSFNANANVTNNLTVGGTISTTGSGGDITMSGGNITGANVITANTANITNTLNGNVGNFTGNVTALNFIGNLANGSSNVRIDSGGNITFSPGTGYGNAVTISSGGVDTIGYITANGNITSNTGFVSNTLTAFANTALTLAAGAATGSANLDITLQPAGNGTVNVSSARITNLAEPNAASDAATKAYVDSVAQGLHIHAPAYVATTTTLNVATGGTVSYTQPGPQGVGATLTVSGGTFHFIDTGNVQTVGTRILVKNEANAAWNGVYTYTNTTTLTRATDQDQDADLAGGDFLFVTGGSVNADTGWVQTTDAVVIGTSNIVFIQFSSAGSYTANTSAGLVLIGSQFNAKVDGNANPTIGFDGSGNLYVPASAHFTTPDVGAATGTSINLTGNVLAGNVNSNALVTAANIEVSGGALVNSITSNTSANITGNLTANNANITNNITVGSANVTGNLQGNVANFSGNLTAANGDFGSGTIIVGTANVSGNLNGNVANFSGNLTSLNANLGNLVTANYVNVANDLNVTGTANISNVSTSGNITANNITSNNRVTATNIKIGNSYIYANTVTTTSTTPTEICSFMITDTDVYGIEYIVKSFDPTSGHSKYSMATVQAVTNGTDVDYVTYATVRLGNTTGQLSVTRTAVSSDVSINLIATPSSGNSTTWTTQYRLI